MHDWKLPENWKEIIHEGFMERLDKYRSLKVFMDTCVRCGACADKCHFFIGSGDPKNMPVLRAELLRSIYRNDFTTAGQDSGPAGRRPRPDPEVLKEWYYYFFQCTECRRCSVYCPYGIDTAEITMMARELLNLIGPEHQLGHGAGGQLPPHRQPPGHPAPHLQGQHRVPVRRTRGHHRHPASIRPSTRRAPSALHHPLGGLFRRSGDLHLHVGYLLLFEYLGLNYTLSAYASEGGNFGLFTSHDTIKKLNYKIYHEAKRLGVKWILGGECGHMWRVMHQYMDTMNGPTDFMEVPRSPYTGTVFHNAASTKMVHICEFTADLIRHNKLKLDPSRNDRYRVTFHDSCNPARAMGLFDEPRYVLRNVCNHFVDMPENTIREHTFCCGGGAGLGNDENMEMRLRGGLPRANAVKYVHEKHDVNLLSCVCAIDRATLPPLMEYWVPQVDVSGVHELVGNALIMPGENERTTNLRNEPLHPDEEEVNNA
jgi:Fe-S oxidoreductase